MSNSIPHFTPDPIVQHLDWVGTDIQTLNQLCIHKLCSSLVTHNFLVHPEDEGGLCHLKYVSLDGFRNDKIQFSQVFLFSLKNSPI